MTRLEFAEAASSAATRSSTDILPFKLQLPEDLREGDWIEFGLAGAYTNAMSTRFNGFAPRRWVVIDGPDSFPPGIEAI